MDGKFTMHSAMLLTFFPLGPCSRLFFATAHSIQFHALLDVVMQLATDWPSLCYGDSLLNVHCRYFLSSVTT